MNWGSARGLISGRFRVDPSGLLLRIFMPLHLKDPEGQALAPFWNSGRSALDFLSQRGIFQLYWPSLGSSAQVWAFCSLLVPEQR